MRNTDSKPKGFIHFRREKIRYTWYHFLVVGNTKVPVWLLSVTWLLIGALTVVVGLVFLGVTPNLPGEPEGYISDYRLNGGLLFGLWLVASALIFPVWGLIAFIGVWKRELRAGKIKA